MELRVEVELYTDAGKETVMVDLCDDDIRELAELRAEKNYTCNSCQAKGIEVTARY